jgi:hypothetical protein
MTFWLMVLACVSMFFSLCRYPTLKPMAEDAPKNVDHGEEFMSHHGEKTMLNLNMITGQYDKNTC